MLESMLRTSRPLIVGVFTSESSISEINHITTTIGLDLIQLHGEGCPDARYMMLPVIKAVSVGGDDVSEVVRDGVGSVIMLLFDGMKGGSGKVWDWSPSTGLGVPFILAGGLNAENVAEGVKKVGAWGVDVAGGVERSKGIKDAERVVEFCRVVGELER
jgi:phosphoribosylanthranilate isomerase